MLEDVDVCSIEASVAIEATIDGGRLHFFYRKSKPRIRY